MASKLRRCEAAVFTSITPWRILRGYGFHKNAHTMDLRLDIREEALRPLADDRAPIVSSGSNHQDYVVLEAGSLVQVAITSASRRSWRDLTHGA